MPFIISKTNRSISHEQEQQLKSRLGRAIELVPGKSEQYLMLGFEDNCHLWLRGDDYQPMVWLPSGATKVIWAMTSLQPR